jgi:hypothetical protein
MPNHIRISTPPLWRSPPTSRRLSRPSPSNWPLNMPKQHKISILGVTTMDAIF